MLPLGLEGQLAPILCLSELRMAEISIKLIRLRCVPLLLLPFLLRKAQKLLNTFKLIYVLTKSLKIKLQIDKPSSFVRIPVLPKIVISENKQRQTLSVTILSNFREGFLHFKLILS